MPQRKYLPFLDLRNANFFAKFVFMAHERHRIATELLATAEKLTRLAGLLSEEKREIIVPPEILEEVAKKHAAGKCLQCEKIKDEDYRRGVCPACYRRSQSRVMGR